MPAPAATKAAIQRAIEATIAAGCQPIAVTVGKDGSVRIETSVGKSLDSPSPTGARSGPKKWPKR